jgi:hypothetical protein
MDEWFGRDSRDRAERGSQQARDAKSAHILGWHRKSVPTKPTHCSISLVYVQ